MMVRLAISPPSKLFAAQRRRQYELVNVMVFALCNLLWVPLYSPRPPCGRLLNHW